MTRFRISLSIGAAALGLMLAAPSAQAQTSLVLTYVSSNTGDDANFCSSPAMACRSIAAALTKTEPGGEIKCLENHAQPFTFTIDKPITIDCAPGSLIPGFNGAAAITVDLDEAVYPNGVVTLRNLNINGFLGNSIGAPGSDGIRVIGGGAAVHIENVTIQGFAQQGIDFAPSSSIDLFVRNTIVSNNANGGVFVRPAAATAVRGSLSNVSLDQNGGFGLVVAKASGAGAVITVEDTQVEKNQLGLRANGASAFILLTGSTIAHNATGLQVLNGGRIVSSGNNTIVFNTTNGAPTSTVALN